MTALLHTRSRALHRSPCGIALRFAFLLLVCGGDAGAAAPAADSTTTRPDSVRAIPFVRHIRTDTVYVAPTVQVRGKRPSKDAVATIPSARVERVDLTRFLPANVGEAMASVPGVDVVKTGAWDARVSMRGLSGDRVLVLVDGVRMNEVRGHGAETSLVPVGDLEAVEVLPGAGSVRYGSNALGGVVNLVTRRPLLGPRTATLQVSTRLMEPGAGQAGSLRGQWRGPRWGIEVAGGAGRLDALSTPAGEVPNSSYNEANASLRVVARARGTLFEAEHKHSLAHDVGLPAFNSDAGSSGTYPRRGREASRVDIKRFGSGRMRETRLLADVQHFNTVMQETTADSVFVRQRYVGDQRRIAVDDVRTTGFGVAPSMRLALPGSPRLQLEYRRDATDGPRDVEETVRDRNGVEVSRAASTTQSVPVSWRDVLSVGCLLQHEVRSIHLESGARWDRVHARAAGSGDGRFVDQDVAHARTSIEGGAARPWRALEPYVHAGTGFRAPNLDERYFNGFMHGFLHVFGNPDLRAERCASMELGVRLHHPWRALRTARLNAYRSNVDDLITIRYVGQLYLVPRFQYANVRRARLDGIEAAAELEWRRTRFGISASSPRGIDRDTRTRVTDVGPARVALNSSIRLPQRIPQGLLSVQARWTDAVQGTGDVLAEPAFWTTAVQMAARFRNVDAVLALRNVFDSAYQEPLSLIPEPGRSIALALRMDFDLLNSKPENRTALTAERGVPGETRGSGHE